jgi:hypothetical protein
MSFDFVPIAKLDDGIDKGDTVGMCYLCHTSAKSIVATHVLIKLSFSDIIGVVKEDEGIQEIISKASGKPVKCLLPCLIPYDALLTDINLYRSRKDS